jgi:hypothetical protein
VVVTNNGQFERELAALYRRVEQRMPVVAMTRLVVPAPSRWPR